MISATKVALSPNPLTSNLLMVEHASISGNVRIQVIDLSGKVIRETDYSYDESQEGYTVDMTDVAQGAYIIRLISTRGNASSLLIRQ
jgi:hypothetical protein